jgi:hypothetical protein
MATPTQQFDLSSIANLPATNKINGNTVGDIRDAYQVYTTGAAPAGSRVQGYVTSGMAKYGYATPQDWASAYLQAAGIPIISNLVSSITGVSPGSGTTGNGSSAGPVVTTPTNGTGTTSDLTGLINTQFQTLANAFQQAFGNAIYEPPLQNQYYSGGVPADTSIYDPSQVSGFTSMPAQAAQPVQAAGGRVGLGTLLLILGLGVGAYLLYRHYHKS